MINDLIDHVGNLGMMSLGVLTIVCVVIFIIWILLELLRLILNIGVKYIYHHASSKNKTKYLHPGFIEIIKQLSPVDCRVLMYLHDNQSKFEVITAIKRK